MLTCEEGKEEKKEEEDPSRKSRERERGILFLFKLKNPKSVMPQVPTLSLTMVESTNKPRFEGEEIRRESINYGINYCFPHVLYLLHGIVIITQLGNMPLIQGAKAVKLGYFGHRYGLCLAFWLTPVWPLFGRYRPSARSRYVSRCLWDLHVKVYRSMISFSSKTLYT